MYTLKWICNVGCNIHNCVLVSNLYDKHLQETMASQTYVGWKNFRKLSSLWWGREYGRVQQLAVWQAERKEAGGREREIETERMCIYDLATFFPTWLPPYSPSEFIMTGFSLLSSHLWKLPRRYDQRYALLMLGIFPNTSSLLMQNSNQAKSKQSKLRNNQV